MRTGRPRKPIASHILDGTLRRDRHGGAFVPAAEGAPETPPWLVGDALAEWNRLVPILCECRILSPNDQATLAIHCEAISDFWKLHKQIEQQGWLINTQTWEKKINPLVGAMDSARKTAITTGNLLGMSPSGRASIKPNVLQKDPVKDDGDKFFGVVG